MTLLKAYMQAVQAGEIEDSLAQREVLPCLQRIANQLIRPKKNWLRLKRQHQHEGLYLYGPVGTGKTYLIDLLCQSVPDTSKMRVHFHDFMRQINVGLRDYQGKSDPLRHIAVRLAKSTRLLCLDEFLVHDIAHAMILATLLEQLFLRGVILVATSNTKPDDLYRNGLQRKRFLPAIDLLKSHCEVRCLSPGRDYRLARPPAKEAYFYPLNDNTRVELANLFTKFAANYQAPATLTIQQRTISCVRLSKKAVWFRFEEICNVPRSQLDYLEIAERFHIVFLTDIPVLTAEDLPRVILLMLFIDVMYDKGVVVIFSAESPPDALYTDGPMQTAFQRTLSRLYEMQSADYLSRHGS